jgi:peptidoglycan/xylan/chitin deacetylase (PgdA/CDA1 family)
VPTIGRLRSPVGRFEFVVADISGDQRRLEEAAAGLPPGAARAEALAVRLRHDGARVIWSDPVVVQRRELLARCSERGRSSVEIARTDSSLLTELQLGAWFDSVWWLRLLRQLSVPVARLTTAAEVRFAADVAFWRGVRSRATDEEWRRWTKTSYTALVYHRLAGERKAGQERIDLAPERFARQLRVLRALGFKHLPPDELFALHEGVAPGNLRRAFAITLDDGLLDCLAPLLDHAEPGVQLFISTAEVGGAAHWLDAEPLLGWDEVRRLADAKVAVGSHARHHRRLTDLTPAEISEELVGSRSDLARQLGSPLSVLAYPNGAYDQTVRAVTVEAGFRAAFATGKGRNGVGTDKYALRRVSVHAADGALAILWKVTTGEGLPHTWLRFRRFRGRARAVIRQRFSR